MGQAAGGVVTSGPRSKKPHRVLIIALTCGLLVMLSGCDIDLFDAVAGAEPAGPGLGDPATIDPCGFFTAPSFAATSATAPQTHQPEVRIVPYSFTDCTISVALPRGAATVDIATSLRTETNTGQADLRTDNLSIKGKFRIVAPKKQPQHECDEVLYVPDHTTLEIDVRPRDDSADDADFCGLADIAVNDAMAAITAGAKHLAPYPSNSAGSVNACSLLDNTTVSAALGRPGLTLWPGIANRSCTYGQPNEESGDEVWVQTRLVNEPMGIVPDSGMSASTVAGRTTVFNPWGGNATGLELCAADTLVKEWKPWPGSMADFQYSPGDPAPSKNLIEYEDIIAQIHGSADQACAIAKQLAASAWAKLPAAS